MANPAGESPTRGAFLYTFGGREYDLGSRTHVMGILNVTPDSFSDGGEYLTVARAVDRGLAMAEEGADFIDVGGESTRPKGSTYGEGAEPVSPQEELDRVLPVIEELARHLTIPISVDTYKSAVASAALGAGAAIVNDISGFGFDPEMAAVVGRTGASAVVMHIRGTPKTMQNNPVYDDLFGEIHAYLGKAVRSGEVNGVRQMLVDPGIGFGKSAADNYRLLAGLHRFGDLGYPVLAGPSRKSFLASPSGLPVHDRLEASLAAATSAVLSGAHVVRVHDVRETRRAVAVADAVRRASR